MRTVGMLPETMPARWPAGAPSARRLVEELAGPGLAVTRLTLEGGRGAATLHLAPLDEPDPPAREEGRGPATDTAEPDTR